MGRRRVRAAGARSSASARLPGLTGGGPAPGRAAEATGAWFPARRSSSRSLRPTSALTTGPRRVPACGSPSTTSRATAPAHRRSSPSSKPIVVRATSTTPTVPSATSPASATRAATWSGSCPTPSGPATLLGKAGMAGCCSSRCSPSGGAAGAELSASKLPAEIPGGFEGRRGHPASPRRVRDALALAVALAGRRTPLEALEATVEGLASASSTPVHAVQAPVAGAGAFDDWRQRLTRRRPDLPPLRAALCSRMIYRSMATQNLDKTAGGLHLSISFENPGKPPFWCRSPASGSSRRTGRRVPGSV